MTDKYRSLHKLHLLWPFHHFQRPVWTSHRRCDSWRPQRSFPGCRHHNCEHQKHWSSDWRRGCPAVHHLPVLCAKNSREAASWLRQAQLDGWPERNRDVQHSQARSELLERVLAAVGGAVRGFWRERWSEQQRSPVDRKLHGLIDKSVVARNSKSVVTAFWYLLECDKKNSKMAMNS